MQDVGFAADLAVFDITLFASCAGVNGSFVPFTASRALIAGRVDHFRLRPKNSGLLHVKSPEFHFAMLMDLVATTTAGWTGAHGAVAGHGQFAVRSAGECDERWIVAYRGKYRIHAGFHHLF